MKMTKMQYRGSSACMNSTSTIFQKDPYLFGLHENISLARSNIVLFELARISFSDRTVKKQQCLKATTNLWVYWQQK